MKTENLILAKDKFVWISILRENQLKRVRVYAVVSKNFSKV